MEYNVFNLTLIVLNLTKRTRNLTKRKNCFVMTDNLYTQKFIYKIDLNIPLKLMLT